MSSLIAHCQQLPDNVAFIVFMVILFIGSIIAGAIDEECEEYGVFDIPNEDIYPLW